VDIAAHLKHHTAMGYTRRPVVETTFAFAHTLLVTTRIHGQVGGHARVQPENLATQAPADDFDGKAELFGGDALVVGEEADAVVAPGDGSAA
jgi:hypothetical protein